MVPASSGAQGTCHVCLRYLGLATANDRVTPKSETVATTSGLSKNETRY